jgi:CelD/BcsL family acetyltransferase involved in cellulose biosynthesis
MTAPARGTLVAAVAGWETLAGRSVEANPFFSPAITTAAVAHLGGERVQLAAPEVSGRLLALAPVVSTRLGRIAPAVSVWTHRYGPLGTPLLDGEAPDEAAERLVHAMAPSGTDRAILLFPDLPLDGPSAAILRRFATAERRPVAEIGAYRRAALRRAPNEETPFHLQIERRRRKEFARQRRRLAESGNLAARRVGPGPDLESAAMAFLALEAEGWKGRRGTALAADPASRAFALAAMLGSPEGSVTIDQIDLDGNPVAMLVSFRVAGLAVTWKIAHDEAFARFSPGVQVMLEASENWLADPSVTNLDSLAAADHPMIDGLWPERIRIGVLAIGPVGGSSLFDLGVAAATAEAEARRRYRAWKHSRRRSRPAEETAA